MFGLRALSVLARPLVPAFRAIPKYDFSMINKQTSLMQQSSSFLPSNLVIKNLLEMLQKMGEQADRDSQQEIKDIKNIALLNQGTLRMCHLLSMA